MGTHHLDQDREHPRTQKLPCVPHQLVTLHGNQCSSPYHLRFLLPLLEFWVNGVIQYVLSPGRFPALNTPIAALSWQLVFFTAVYCSTKHTRWWPPTFHNDRHLGGLQFLATENTVLRTSVYMTFGGHRIHFYWVNQVTAVFGKRYVAKKTILLCFYWKCWLL